MEPCSCKRNCSEEITEEDRIINHKTYWSNKDIKGRNHFITTHVKAEPVKRRRSRNNDENKDDPIRNATYTYELFKKISDNQSKTVVVCRTFFLATLGYKSNNGNVIKLALRNMNPVSYEPKDVTIGTTRSRSSILSRQEAIKAHVETFHPEASHYRRVHAPNRRYLPNDFTIKFLWEDFKSNHPDYVEIKYETYRREFDALNITICKLGHEECELCERVDQHAVGHSKHSLSEDCNDCQSWTVHIERAKQSRELYEFHANISSSTPDTIFYSVDMEKVIMLPRLETFKEALFTRRISAYNESFAPMGTFSDRDRPIIAPLWHEGISGRKQEQIISAYHQFFLANKDRANIVLWLDNCSSQNKNWCFLSYLVYIINSDLVSTETIDVYFFEPGHTFMSADSFHHSVERSMKAKKNVYTFEDFQECVATSLPYVKTIRMTPEMFKNWRSYRSTKVDAREEKFYLKDVKRIMVTRGKYSLEYGTTYAKDEGLKELDFLIEKIIKEGFPMKVNSQPSENGISQDKKTEF